MLPLYTTIQVPDPYQHACDNVIDHDGNVCVPYSAHVTSSPVELTRLPYAGTPLHMSPLAIMSSSCMSYHALIAVLPASIFAL